VRPTQNVSNVNPYAPGRTVCWDGFSFGGSGRSRYAWKPKVPACIDCVTLGLLPDQTPVTLITTLTVLSLVLSVPSTTSRLTPHAICDNSSSRNARWAEGEAEMTTFKGATSEGQVKVRNVDPGSFSARKARSSKRI
jgi:hypothetical protein